jgi:hypothetical protein
LCIVYYFISFCIISRLAVLLWELAFWNPISVMWVYDTKFWKISLVSLKVHYELYDMQVQRFFLVSWKVHCEILWIVYLALYEIQFYHVGHSFTIDPKSKSFSCLLKRTLGAIMGYLFGILWNSILSSRAKCMVCYFRDFTWNQIWRFYPCELFSWEVMSILRKLFPCEMIWALERFCWECDLIVIPCPSDKKCTCWELLMCTSQ